MVKIKTCFILISIVYIFYFTFSVYYPWQTPKVISSIPQSLGLHQRWGFFHKFSPVNNGLRIQVLYKDGAEQDLQYPIFSNLNFTQQLTVAERYRKYLQDNLFYFKSCRQKKGLAHYYFHQLSEQGQAIQPFDRIEKLIFYSWRRRIKNPAEEFVSLSEVAQKNGTDHVFFEIDPAEAYADCP